MSRVVTLRVAFFYMVILVELAMCKNTTTMDRKLIFGPILLAMTPLVIIYSVVAYLTAIDNPHVCIIWKTAV